MAIDWMTIDKANGNGDITLGVSANANAATSSRNARIKIISTDGSIVKYVSVIQEGKENYLSIIPQNLEFSREESNAYVSIETNLYMWRATTNDDWITFPQGQTGLEKGETLRVKVYENTTGSDRNGVITITASDVYGETKIIKTINVVQYANKEVHYFTIDPYYMSLEPKAYLTENNEACAILIYATDEWTASVDADWIIEDTEHRTNYQYVFEVSENTGASRTAHINFYVNGVLQRTAVIEQKEAYIKLEVSPANIEFDYDGGEEFITITASGSWSITTPDWIEVTTKRGNGDKTLMVKADKSTVNSDRSGVITITMGNRSATVNVIQRYTGKLTISPSSAVFSYTGAVYQTKNKITVSSTGAWTSSKTDDWFSMNKTSGSSGDTQIRFTAQPWSGTEPRSGKVNFYLDGLLKATAVISQLPQSFKTTIIEYTKSANDGDGAVEPNIPDVFGVPIIDNIFNYTITETGSGEVNTGEYYVVGTVKEVKANGFKNCLLSSITLPDTVEKIGDYAFMNTHLTHFEYPSSTYDVGVGAFMNNKKMNTVITNNLITEIKDYTFFNTKFYIGLGGECVLGKNITKIGDNAFSYNTLSRLIIPSKVQEISKNAFTSAFDENNAIPQVLCFTGAKPLVKSNGAIADVGGFTDIGGLSGKNGLLTHFPTYDYSSWFQGDSSFTKQGWKDSPFNDDNVIYYVTTDGSLEYPQICYSYIVSGGTEITYKISFSDDFDYYYGINIGNPHYKDYFLISNTYNGKGKWIFDEEVQVGAGLFAPDSKIKEIELPNSILYIDFDCFYSYNTQTSSGKNDALEVIRIGNKLQQIQTAAFNDLPNLTDVYITATTAPSIVRPSSHNYSNVVLHYPSGSDYSTWIRNFGFTGVADL